MNSSGLLTALETVEPQAREAQADVARLERELRVAQDRAQRLASIVENLRALAHVDMEVAADDDGISQSDDKTPDPDESQGSEPVRVEWEPPKPRRPSATKLVAEVVNSGSGAMTRDDIAQVMTARGYTDGMQKPASNINVAIKRAVEQGLIVATLAGTYHPTGWGADASDHGDDGRTQDQLVDGGDGDAEM